MDLLRRIKALLQDQGMTIRGAQLALGQRAPAAAPPPERPVPPPPTTPAIDREALRAIRNRLAAALGA